MNAMKLKIRFWTILFMAVGFSFLFYSSTVNHILGPGVALAADDPGCTNEDCPPDYWNNCCCYEEYNEGTNRIERICCCRDDQRITCRESYVISYSPPLHGLLQQIDINTNVCTDNAQQQCAPDWFSIFIGNYWGHLEESCSWWGDLQQWRMDVEIDIKPGSSKNCININDKGVIPVAINGTEIFDVHQVDIYSLKLALLEVRIKGNSLPQCGYDDWNNDGQVDLICHFMDDSTVWDSVNGEAALTGYLLDGTPFKGSDTVCIVP
jgi:hypothetical protein